MLEAKTTVTEMKDAASFFFFPKDVSDELISSLDTAGKNLSSKITSTESSQQKRKQEND